MFGAFYTSEWGRISIRVSDEDKYKVVLSVWDEGHEMLEINLGIDDLGELIELADKAWSYLDHLTHEE